MRFTGNEQDHVPLSMALLLDIVFALSESIPQLDGPVTRTRDDLSVIRAEANGQNIGGMSNKATGGQSSVKIPKTKGMVPR